MPTVAELQIDVDADIAAAEAGLAQVNALIDAMAGKSSDISVDADISEFKRKTEEVSAILDKVGTESATVNVGGNGDFGGLSAQLASLQAVVDSIDGRTIDIQTEIDGLTESMTGLAAVDAAATKLDGKRVNIHVDADTANVRRELARLGNSVVDTSRNLDRTVRLVAGLATVMAPAIVVATGAVGALTSSLLGAGVGAVGFGAVAVGVFKPVAAAIHQMTLAQDAANRAVDDKARDAALARMKAAYDSLTPAQQKMADSVMNLTDAWNRFTASFQPQVFDLASRGLDRFAQIIPRLSPMISGMATAIGNLGTRLSRALDTPRYQQFFDFLNRTAGPSFQALVQGLGNVIEGIFSLALAFEPLARRFNAGFVSMTRRFAEWAAGLAKNQAFQRFVQDVIAYTPVVLRALGSFARAIWSLIEALAPIGARALPIISRLFDAFSHLQEVNPQLATLAVAIAGIVASIILLASPVAAIFSAFRLLGGVIAALARAAGIAAGPIAAIAAAVLALAGAAIWAYRNIPAFKKAVDDAAAAIAAFARVAGPRIIDGLKAAWRWLVSTFGPAVSAVVDFVVQEWDKMVSWARDNAPLFMAAWDRIKSALSTSWGQIVAVFRSAWQLITSIWNAMWPGLSQVVRGVWQVIKGIISGALSVIRGYITIFAGLITGDWQAVWDGLKMVVSGWGTIIGGLLRGAFNIIVGAFRALGGLLLSVWTAAWNGLKDSWGRIWDGIVSAIQSAIANFPALLSAGVQIIQSLIQGLEQAWPGVVTWLSQLPGRIATAVGDATTWLITHGAEIVAGLVRGMVNGLVAVVTFLVELPMKIDDYFADAVTWLLGHGGEIIQGLVTGMRLAIPLIAAAILAIPALIVGVLTAQIGILIVVGAEIINGLITGIRNAIPNVLLIFTQLFAQIQVALAGGIAQIKTAWDEFWINTVPAPIRAGIQIILTTLQLLWNLILTMFQSSFTLLSTAWSVFWQTMQAGPVGFFTFLLTTATALFGQLVAVFTGGLTGLKTAWDTFWNALPVGIQVTFQLIAAAITAGITLLLTPFTLFFTQLRTAWDTFWNALPLGLQVTFQTIAAVVTAGLTLLLTPFLTFFAQLKAIWDAFWATITAGWTTVWTVLRAAPAAFFAFLLTTAAVTFAQLSAIFSGGIAGLVGVVQSGLSAIRSAFQTAMSAVTSVVQSGFSAIRSAVQAGMSAARTAVQSGLSTIRSLFQSTMSAIRTAVQTGMSGVVSAVQSGMNRFVSAVRSGGNQAVSAVRSVVSAMVSAVRAGVGGMASAGAAMMSGLASGVRSAGARAIAAAHAVVARIAAIMPGSPAETGPLSGQGYTQIRGQHFSEDLARGIRMENDQVRRAVEQTANAMSFAMPTSKDLTPTYRPTPTYAAGSGRDTDRIVAAIRETPKAAPVFNFTTHNPILEPESITMNKALQRVASLGLVD